MDKIIENMVKIKEKQFLDRIKEDRNVKKADLKEMVKLINGVEDEKE
jgi:hypothetical protein